MHALMALASVWCKTCQSCATKHQAGLWSRQLMRCVLQQVTLQYAAKAAAAAWCYRKGVLFTFCCIDKALGFCLMGRKNRNTGMLTNLASFVQLLVQPEVISCILLASEDLRCAVTGHLVLLISTAQSACKRAVESDEGFPTGGRVRNQKTALTAEPMATLTLAH